jgi:beta-galactosidase
VLFGASYYHEYQPYERLDTDLDMMVGAGFTVIRVGESTWASYEPSDGHIGFDALERVVDRAHDKGLSVVVGTPTYAIPSWLARAHPEVMAQTSTETPLPFGARQNVDFTSPAYRFYAERMIRRLGACFGGRAGVIGFQVDNEIGVHELTNPHIINKFREHVLRKFGSVDQINRAWGLTYWSHRLSNIGDLWAPDGNSNPGYALEWARFQAALAVSFLEWQRDLLRKYIAADQFVTHDLIGGAGGSSTEIRAISEALDRTSANIYFPMQDALALPEPEPAVIRALAPAWMDDGGTWSVSWRADLAYSAKGPRGTRFYATEVQAGSIGPSSSNAPPYPGQLRLVAHQMIARGADMIAYWHWHTLHYGFETYWGGVLGHDLEPNRILREATELGDDLRALDPVLARAQPESDVAFLYSRDSAKALEFMPAFNLPDSSDPDEASYHRVFRRLYQGASDAGLQVRIVHADSDWTGEKVLVVPALYIADDALLEKVKDHARGGAHVLLTFRSGAANENATVRWTRQPGPLREAVGASYQEYTNLATDVPLVVADVPGLPPLDLPPDPVGTRWADLLVTESASTLCKYDDKFAGDYAAISTQAYGSGRMTWMGTLVDHKTAGRLVRWALAERGSTAQTNTWTEASESVRMSTARCEDASRLWFVANHSWEPVTMSSPAGLKELIAPRAGRITATSVELGAWDCCVLVGPPE